MLNGDEQALAGARGPHPGLDSRGSGASLQSLDVADALSSLTPQQFRVASMLVEGLLNKQIAYELNVKEATIKAHMTEIFRKLGVHSRTQAVLAMSSLAVELPADLSDPRPRSGTSWGSRSAGSVALDWLFRVGEVGVRRRGNSTVDSHIA